MESTEARRELDKLKKKAKRNKERLIIAGVVVGVYIITKRTINKQVAKAVIENAPADVWLTTKEVAKETAKKGFKFKASNGELEDLIQKGGGLLFETDSPLGDFVLQSYETWAKVR